MEHAMPRDDETPEVHLLRRSEAQEVRRHLGSVPEPFREVLVLRELEDLSYREIAEVTATPVGTVMSRLARARKLFATAWSSSAERRCGDDTVSPAGHDPGSDWAVLLHGYVDGELDAANALRYERHLAECGACAAELDALRTLKRRLSESEARLARAGHAAAARPRRSTARERRPAVRGARPTPGPHRRSAPRTGSGAGASCRPSPHSPRASCSSSSRDRRTGPPLQDELLAGHVRSLLADHLTDVATSDQHTVKPWFNGRIDFSPPVTDLSSRGYPLVGGRVDYVAGRVVAVLVYRRNGHVINVFVWPSQDPSRSTSERDGYNVIGFGEAGLRFWIVSDLNTVELEEFRQDFAEAIPK